jgi:integrase
MLPRARVAAQRVFAAKLEGRDPAAEKRKAKRRIVADDVEDLLELTGQCREEVAQITWNELDFARRIWTLPNREQRTPRSMSSTCRNNQWQC